MIAPKLETASNVVGRGTRDGARLFREWYTTLSGAAERGEPAAYVFVMGSLEGPSLPSRNPRGKRTARA
jgi:hypothetical protein